MSLPLVIAPYPTRITPNALNSQPIGIRMSVAITMLI
jgi:hypothetical protein